MSAFDPKRTSGHPREKKNSLITKLAHFCCCRATVDSKYRSQTAKFVDRFLGSAYRRNDWRFPGGGMRYALRMGVCAAAILAAPFAAGAADLAPVSPVAPAWSWTSVYAGVHLASGWASNTWQSATGPLADPGFEPFFGLGAGNGAVA